jgi:hypothetical protein
VIEKPGRSRPAWLAPCVSPGKNRATLSADRAAYLLNCLVCTQECRVTSITVQGFMVESNFFFRLPFDLIAGGRYDSKQVVPAVFVESPGSVKGFWAFFSGIEQLWWKRRKNGEKKSKYLS